VPDLAEVRGQLEARRALEIALAGGHCLLMIGPPGSGKTLIARTIPGLLPPLDDEEARVATIIASVSGTAPIRGLIRRRPFRAPHHTISYAAMVGGGPLLSPGEVTLAHNGTLFLDELPEFDRATLEALRQPLEDGHVAIARVGRAAVFPAFFQLIAAMNPCPCGHAGEGDGRCRCQPAIVDRYAGRVSGPLRDRIDLWVHMPRVRPEEYVAQATPEGSAPVGHRVAAARAVQLGRRGGLNARLSGRELRSACDLTGLAQAHAIRLADLEGWSARGTERLLRVARTVADLAGAERVETDHLDEAARFRTPSRRASGYEAVG
jgi:magnesium chelatase family protein